MDLFNNIDIIKNEIKKNIPSKFKNVEECKLNLNEDNIINYLKININPCDTFIFCYKNKKWKSVAGFRRYHYYHYVYISEDNEYAFDVFDGEQLLQKLKELNYIGSETEFLRYEWIPSMGVYKSYNELLKGVAMQYSKSWK
jgi:hypothetical protein